MKKCITFIALLVIVLTLTSCFGKYKGPVSTVSHIETDKSTSSTELSEENQQKILDILNDGKWTSDLPECIYDYEITVDGREIRYSSGCGVFNDVTKSRSITLSEEDKLDVNKLFGVVERVELSRQVNLHVKIVEIIDANTLLVIDEFTPEWGIYYYVITDDANSWCVGDTPYVSFQTIERPLDSTQYVRIIADSINIPNQYGKPIIYLYPEESTVCSVKVDLDGELTCTYPEHSVDGWQNFIAHPDGTLVFPDGKEYYALYWEGINDVEWDMTKGFCVRGEDTAEFLEWALAEQGLTRREANEFIVYWLPLMQENPYNVISFQTTAYTDEVNLDITPAPDSLLRVYMTYYASDREVEIQPQSFESFERQGFTVVEWGGSIIERP